jgi:hypothetical protein
MLSHSVRLLVAILTFTVGIAITSALQSISRLETALEDKFFSVSVSDLHLGNRVDFDSGQDTNEIYRLIIHQRFTFDGQTKLIVLKAETTSWEFYEDNSPSAEASRWETFHQEMGELMPEAQHQTLDDYLLRNQRSEPLKISNLGINYVIVGDRYLLDGPCGFWTNFYKIYPGSSDLISFSNIGFNDEHNQAFVYVARTCRGLCGEGNYVLLQKVNDKWEIRQEINLWVS